MSKFHLDMNTAQVNSLQIGDGNTQYIAQTTTTDISQKEWLQLKNELYQMLEQHSGSEIIKKSYLMIEQKNKSGVKHFFSEQMPSFIRDVMVNLTADSLLVLCKLLFKS